MDPPVILFVLILCQLSGASGTAEVEQNTAAQLEPAEQFAGIDFLHIWLMRAAQSDRSVESIYRKDSHPAALMVADLLAAELKSPRLAAHVRQNRELYQTGLEPTGSPPLYGLAGILRIGDYESDYWLYQICSSLLFLLGLILLTRYCCFNSWATLIVATGLFLFFRPLQVDFLVGNTNRIQLFLFAIASWLFVRDKPPIFLIGILLGLAVMWKANFVVVPLFLLAGLLLQRVWISCAALLHGLLVGSIVGAVAGSWLLTGGFSDPLEPWMLWQGYLSDVLASPYSIETGNYSIVGLAAGSHAAVVAKCLLPVLWMAALAVVAKLRGRLPEASLSWRQDGPLWMAMGLVAFLIASPLAWSHYFLLAIPCFILSLDKLLTVDRSKLRTLGLGMTLVGGVLMCAGSAIPLPDPIAIAVLLHAAMWLLFAGAVFALAQTRR